VAKCVGWDEANLERYCIEHDPGILTRVFGHGPASPEHYDKVCERYGLTVLVHPRVAFSDDEMAAFPIFADTPRGNPWSRITSSFGASREEADMSALECSDESSRESGWRRDQFSLMSAVSISVAST